MKIMQFMASPGYGGAEMVFVELSNALAKEHEVTALLLRGSNYKSRFSKGVNVISLKSHPTINNPFLHFEIASTLKKNRPHIIHTHAVKGAVLISRVNRRLKIPHLATKHNDRKGKIFNRLPWVSCVSLKSKDSVCGVKNKVEVIYNGVDPIGLIKEDKHEIFNIVSIGRLDAIKGFAELIDQVSRLDFDYTLTIIGDGPERSNLESQIVRLGLREKVCLLGFSDNIGRYMQQSHLVIIASHKEGGPKTAIEALFYADILISTPVGMVPEILPASLLVSHGEIAEKIEAVFHNYLFFCEEFKKIKQAHQDRFLLSTTVSAYKQYYHYILGH